MSDLYASLPKSVRVGFFVYTIEAIPAELAAAKQLFGYVDNNTCEIKISDGLSDQQLLNTTFHEVLHAIHWQYALDDESTEEQFTNLGANGLCAFYADNPEFVDWFFGLKDIDTPPVQVRLN